MVHKQHNSYYIMTAKIPLTQEELIAKKDAKRAKKAEHMRRWRSKRSQDTIVKEAARKLIYRRKRRLDPEYKAKEAEYMRVVRSTYKHKEKRSTPEFKLMHKTRCDRYLSKPENRVKRNRYLSSYEATRKAIDPLYKLVKNLRKRITESILGTKSGSSLNYLSETPAFYRDHLESLFQSGMSWDNYGFGDDRWHIDHIRPLSDFTDMSDPDQIREAWHWTNLQPLWQPDNLRKGSNTAMYTVG